MNRFDKYITTPFGRMWISEMLMIIALALIVIAMAWFASTVTQYVVAGIAVVSGLYTAYDWTRPSQGSYAIGQGLLGAATGLVMVVMIIVYGTTLF